MQRSIEWVSRTVTNFTFMFATNKTNFYPSLMYINATQLWCHCFKLWCCATNNKEDVTKQTGQLPTSWTSTLTTASYRPVHLLNSLYDFSGALPHYLPILPFLLVKWSNMVGWRIHFRNYRADTLQFLPPLQLLPPSSLRGVGLYYRIFQSPPPLYKRYPTPTI